MNASRTVLIIDDEPDLVMLLSGAVGTLGHRVVTASDGLEGLEVLKTEKPDLIILDMNMPRMGGVAFYNELAARSRTGRPEVPVLVLTARANLEAFFKDLEVDGFMTKPFEIPDLLREAEAIITARSGAGSPAAPRKAGARPSVLLIDDRDESARRITGAFAAKGIDVHRESAGASGIERAKSLMPDLVLAKLSLPGVTGDIVARRLKDMPVTSGLRVLLYAPGFTGTDRTTLDRICSEAGVDHAMESDDPFELLYGSERVLRAAGILK
jgi:CheY-like chemotaxis protein